MTFTGAVSQECQECCPTASPAALNMTFLFPKEQKSRVSAELLARKQRPGGMEEWHTLRVYHCLPAHPPRKLLLSPSPLGWSEGRLAVSPTVNTARNPGFVAKTRVPGRAPAPRAGRCPPRTPSYGGTRTPGTPVPPGGVHAHLVRWHAHQPWASQPRTDVIPPKVGMPRPPPGAYVLLSFGADLRHF